MNGETSDSASIQSFIEQLNKLASGVDQEDLPTLAKMHSVCEGLLGAPQPDGAEGTAPWSGPAAKLAKSLEAVILGDVEDTREAMTAILEQVVALEKIAVSSPTGSHGNLVRDELSDETVAAKLDRVFEDPAEEAEEDKPSPASESASDHKDDAVEDSDAPSRTDPRCDADAPGPASWSWMLES